MVFAVLVGAFLRVPRGMVAAPSGPCFSGGCNAGPKPVWLGIAGVCEVAETPACLRRPCPILYATNDRVALPATFCGTPSSGAASFSSPSSRSTALALPPPAAAADLSELSAVVRRPFGSELVSRRRRPAVASGLAAFVALPLAQLHCGGGAVVFARLGRMYSCGSSVIVSASRSDMPIALAVAMVSTTATTVYSQNLVLVLLCGSGWTAVSVEDDRFLRPGYVVSLCRRLRLRPVALPPRLLNAAVLVDVLVVSSVPPPYTCRLVLQELDDEELTLSLDSLRGSGTAAGGGGAAVVASGCCCGCRCGCMCLWLSPSWLGLLGVFFMAFVDVSFPVRAYSPSVNWELP